MDNIEVAEVFERIANLLQIRDEPIYRILAYRRASESLRALTHDVEEIWEEGDLERIPGVGKAIAEKIDELLSSGSWSSTSGSFQKYLNHCWNY
ncbi:MAG: hypothetical protein A2Z14_09060 [Chloroflexi bacterium RBG_16_48_8]|nr:MAG: hypothetical protein A2Z14_09060 [Chloroflexi bacterium RBG_16_48_8]